MSTTYNSPNSEINYNVPDDAVMLYFEVVGGKGEDGASQWQEEKDGEVREEAGGKGGLVQKIRGRIPVDGGEQLSLLVGATGSDGGKSPIGNGGVGGDSNGVAGQGGTGGGPSGIRDESGNLLAISDGGGGGGSAGVEQYDRTPMNLAGGGSGGGGGRGGTGAGRVESWDRGDSASGDGLPGEDAEGVGQGGDGGKGGAAGMPGQDGTDGGFEVDPSVSVIETTTTDQDAYILVQPFSVIRGEPVVYESGGESVYTPPERAIGMDIIAVGENGQDGGDADDNQGGSGGVGAEIRGRIPFEVESEYTIAPATLDPAGNGGAGYRDGGRGGNSSGVVRRSDGKRLLTAGGGGGGGGAGRWYSYQGQYYTYYEWVGGGGGGGGPNGSGGSGHTGASSWNVDETPESDPGQDGSGSGSTGGNGGDGGYTNPGNDGTDGSTYAAESVDVTQQTTNDEAAYVQVVPLYSPVTEPENVSASAAGETSVSLSYDLPDGAEGANIYRGTSGDVDSLTPIDSVDAGTAPYLDESVEKGKEYFYAVTSTVSTYESVKSEIVSVTLSKPVKVWTGTEWASGEMKIFDGQDWAAMSGLSVAGASDWNQLN